MDRGDFKEAIGWPFSSPEKGMLKPNMTWA